jgi:hemerythrin superfamily protein
LPEAAIGDPREQNVARAADTQGAANQNAAESTPDILSLLAADHAEVSAALDEYEDMGEDEDQSSGRQELAQRICRMLTVHSTIEEEFFYPAAREAGVDPDLLDEAGVEHASVKRLIEQIQASDPDDRLYDAKVKVLGEYVRHHVDEEEGPLFDECRRTNMDLYAIVMPMATRRAELMQSDGSAARGRGKRAAKKATAAAPG